MLLLPPASTWPDPGQGNDSSSYVHQHRKHVECQSILPGRRAGAQLAGQLTVYTRPLWIALLPREKGDKS